MITVHIEHAVPNYDGWKLVFDRDPADREGSGVCHYRVVRSIEDPNFVMIDLDFDDLTHAQAFLDTMQAIWAGPGRDVMRNPQARIAEIIETVDL